MGLKGQVESENSEGKWSRERKKEKEWSTRETLPHDENLYDARLDIAANYTKIFHYKSRKQDS